MSTRIGYAADARVSTITVKYVVDSPVVALLHEFFTFLSFAAASSVHSLRSLEN